MPTLGSVSSSLLHQEISRLNALLEEKISECEQLEREAASIRRKSKERIQTLEQQVGVLTYFWLTCPRFGKVLPPLNYLLTYSFPSLQVLIYTEDFKSERADRERAQGQIDDLKEQVYQLKRQLHKQVRGQTLYEVAVFLCVFFVTHVNSVTSLTSAGSEQREQRHGACVLCAHWTQDLDQTAQRLLGAPPEGLS